MVVHSLFYPTAYRSEQSRRQGKLSPSSSLLEVTQTCIYYFFPVGHCGFKDDQLCRSRHRLWGLLHLSEPSDKWPTCPSVLCVSCVTDGASSAPARLVVTDMASNENNFGFWSSTAVCDCRIWGLQPCQSVLGECSAMPPALAPTVIQHYRAIGPYPGEVSEDLEHWQLQYR